MTRTVVSTTTAPAAIGPYSQGVATDTLLFVSGQLPIDPATGIMIEGDIGAKTRRILENLSAIAAAAGTSLDRALKTTVFLTDLGEFKAMNEAYGTFFTEAPPARSTVQVAALPLGSNIEIECILAR
jgi:2-iminobutanoate/2-iminopropanoate deaminase